MKINDYHNHHLIMIIMIISIYTHHYRNQRHASSSSAAWIISQSFCQYHYGVSLRWNFIITIITIISSTLSCSPEEKRHHHRYHVSSIMQYNPFSLQLNTPWMTPPENLDYLQVKSSKNLQCYANIFLFSIFLSDFRGLLYNVNSSIEAGWVAWNHGCLLFRPVTFDSTGKIFCFLLDPSSLKVCWTNLCVSHSFIPRCYTPWRPLK